MRAIPLALISGFWLLVAACASLSPTTEQPKALQWEAATECEARFSDIRVKEIDYYGRLSYEYGAPGGINYRDDFIACYQQRVQEKFKSLISSGRLSPSAQATPKTSVPIKVVETKILVSVTINESQRASLVLDTGAAYTTLRPALLERLGISVPASTPLWKLSLLGRESISLPFARVQSLKVGDVAVEDIDVGVYDAFPTAQGVDGLLGGDFLNHFRVSIDRGSQRLTLEIIQPKVSAQDPPVREARKDQPISPERAAAQKAPTPTPQPTPAPLPSTMPLSAAPLAWKPGYEWSFRWESPRGKGTFVWVVAADTEVNGLPSYVVKSGSREIAFAKGDGKLGWHVQKVDGVLVERASPPPVEYTWPLYVRKSWEYSYTWEGIRDRQTDERTRRCTVEATESITVPAGTFQTFRVACRNQIGGLTYTYWFSEAVKMFVKDRSYFSYGMRNRELTGYKLD